MFQDNSLIFFEGKTAPAEEKVLKVNGSGLARDFVYCTIPAGVTALSLAVSYSKDGTNWVTHTFAAAEADIKRGVMQLPTPLNEATFMKVVPTITGTAEKDLVCGIMDGVDNTEVFYTGAEDADESES